MAEKKDPGLQGTMSKDEEAYAWVVRLESDQRTSDDAVRFEQWLREDDGNAGRFADGLALWDELGGLKGSSEAHAALGHLYSVSPLEGRVVERWRPSRRAVLGGGVAALAASMAGVLVIPRVLAGPTIYETAKGEQRRVALSDGSAMVLDTATRVEVAMEENQRLITLVTGQVFFDVARDPARPFRVFAGDDEIRALGTAFQVRFEGMKTNVILEEGRIAIFRGGALKPAKVEEGQGSLDAKKADVVLAPGEATQLASSQPLKVEPVDLSKTNAWRDGDLVFDDVALSTAVAEVNRYGGRQIVLGDPQLSALRISGTFHTNRPEAFVEGVTAALPVRLQQSDASQLVLKEI